MYRSLWIPVWAPVLVATPALAQVSKSVPTSAVNSDVVALRTAVDLVAKDVGLSPLGEVTFALANRGAVGVNAPTRPSPGGVATRRGAAGGDGSRIRIDVHVGGALVQSVYQPSLAGQASVPFAVKLQGSAPRCLESRDIRIVVDPQNVFPELHEDNNQAQRTAERPCPDLAVKSIERDKEGVMGETYRVKVTVVNLGNAPAPASQALATAMSTAPGVTGWPEFGPNESIPALAPGQSFSFKVGGSVLSVDNSWVRVILDRYFHLDETDESNNRVDRRL